MRIKSLGWEDPREEEMATHSSMVGWKIPRSEETRGPQSVGSQRLSPSKQNPVFLLPESPGVHSQRGLQS